MSTVIHWGITFAIFIDLTHNGMLLCFARVSPRLPPPGAPAGS
jgi:hypothetical protein